MSTACEKLKALLATGRVANLPTVWSNVLVAFWMASSLFGFYHLPENALFRYILLLTAATAASLLYLGGCLLGDWRDLHYDHQHRPDRPLPQGVLTPGLVATLGFSSMGLGAFLGCTTNLISGFLAYSITFSELVRACKSGEILELIELHEILMTTILTSLIFIYAFFHKRSRIVALPLMAACRMCLIIFATSLAYKGFFGSSYTTKQWQPDFAWFTPLLILFAGTIAIYTLLLSCVASTESSEEKFTHRRILGTAMLLLPCIFYFFIPMLHITGQAHAQSTSLFFSPPFNDFNLGFFLGILAIYLGWTLITLNTLKVSKPSFVSRALAGFCLLDACFAATFSPLIAIICLGLFLLALLLQRFTPAT